MGFSAKAFVRERLGPFQETMALAKRRVETALLISTKRNARRGLKDLRSEMQGKGLRGLGNAIGSTSDVERTRTVHRRGNGFSASGLIVNRSGSERSCGAIEIYSKSQLMNEWQVPATISQT